MKVNTTSPEATQAIAKKFSRLLFPGDIVCLYGDLGAGKTTFVKGLAQGLKINPNRITSPTFVLMNIYDGKLPIYHFDLYRLEGFQDLGAGYDDYLFGEGVSVVEWAEKFGDWLPKEHISIHMKHLKNGRSICITTQGNRYKMLKDKLKALQS